MPQAMEYLMCVYRTAATKIPHGDHKNYNWSVWAACVCFFKFLMSMESLGGEDIYSVAAVNLLNQV